MSLGTALTVAPVLYELPEAKAVPCICGYEPVTPETDSKLLAKETNSYSEEAKSEDEST